MSYKEPFHGAIKKDFGFQITLKVAEQTEAADVTYEGALPPFREKLPAPTPLPDR